MTSNEKRDHREFLSKLTDIRETRKARIVQLTPRSLTQNEIDEATELVYGAIYRPEAEAFYAKQLRTQFGIDLNAIA